LIKHYKFNEATSIKNNLIVGASAKYAAASVVENATPAIHQHKVADSKRILDNKDLLYPYKIL